MIGLIGGTFDPIHFGHLRPALEITETLGLEHTRFIPSARPPHRWQPEASAEHRLAMVKLAIQDVQQFVLDDREYQRPGASFTIDTVKSLREEFGKQKPLCLLIGMDALQSFTTWRDWQGILACCHLVISPRPGYSPDLEQKWISQRLTDDVNQLKAAPAGKLLICSVKQFDISATYIRKQLLNGKSLRYLTPKKVCDYIARKGLYEYR